MTVDASAHACTPSVQSSLDRSLLVADFFRLQDSLPFTANIVGHTAECGDVTETRAGVPLRPVLLVDAVGYYVHCVAFGWHAEDERLEDNCEVALYLAHAREGLQGKNGSLWLYDESHLAVLRHAAVAPAQRHGVQLQAHS